MDYTRPTKDVGRNAYTPSRGLEDSTPPAAPPGQRASTQGERPPHRVTAPGLTPLPAGGVIHAAAHVHPDDSRPVLGGGPLQDLSQESEGASSNSFNIPSRDPHERPAQAHLVPSPRPEGSPCIENNTHALSSREHNTPAGVPQERPAQARPVPSPRPESPPHTQNRAQPEQSAPPETQNVRDNPQGAQTGEPPESNQNKEFPHPEDIHNKEESNTNRQRLRTRAGITIASLNMKGRYHAGIDKWNHINQIVRDNRIGILALQETHITKSDEVDLSARFGTRLHIVSTIEQGRSRAAGVAIVVNKHLADTSNIKTHEIVAGRAILAEIPWHRNHTVTILAVYAPNEDSLNQKFWKDISSGIQQLPAPDVILGDFNMTEDAIDRLPPRNDPDATVNAFRDLKQKHNLIDGWRKTFPVDHKYTYAQTITQGGSQSRIDRIYIKEPAWLYCHDWRIGPVGINTDHEMVSMHMSDPTLPFIGPGRWTLPLHLLTNDAFMEGVIRMCAEAVDRANTLESRSDELNVQTIFEELKDDIKAFARKDGRKMISRLDRQISALQSDINNTANRADLDIDSKKCELAFLNAKLKTLQAEKHKKARDRVMARYRLESECATSKLWAKSGRERKPRDTIMELRKPSPRSGEPAYEKKSSKMAKIAWDYHNALQSLDLDDSENRTEATQNVLGHVKRFLLHEQAKTMAENVSKDEVELALRALPNGKATGINGLPYELWKELARRFEKRKTNHRRLNYA